MATCARLDPPCRGAGLRPPGASGFFGPRCGGERAAPDARRLLDGPHAHLDWLSVQNTTTFRLVDDAWRFPLEIGNSSVVTRRMNFSEDFRFFYGLQSTPLHTQGSLWWNATYNLEAQVAIDTPAGHFDAYRIREAAPDGTYGLLYYAPATGNDARTEAYNGTAKVATSELTSYRYQALEPARTFVV